MSVVSNLVGNRVFRASSSAPNRGQVSVQGANGYLQRSLNQRATTQSAQYTPVSQGSNPLRGGVSQWGADGQSDTRSGVTENTLDRLDNNNPGQPGAVKSFAGQSTPGLKSMINPDTNVQITKTGALKLPFNFKYSAGILNQKKAAMANLLKIQQARQAEAIEYQNNLYDANSGYDKTRLSTLSDNAARGTAFSSGYGKSVADNASTFNTLIGKLASAEKLSKTNEIQASNQERQSLNDYLKMAAVEQGYTYDQEAGRWKLKDKKKSKSKKKK